MIEDIIEVCGMCSAINNFKNVEQKLSSNLINVEHNEKSFLHLPKLQNKLKNDVNTYLENCRLTNKNKILGIIKFKSNVKEYIHCPIKKIYKSGKVKIGVCKHFKCLEDTRQNRLKLSTHKFRYHFKSDKNLSNVLKLKVSKSIEEVFYLI